MCMCVYVLFVYRCVLCACTWDWAASESRDLSVFAYAALGLQAYSAMLTIFFMSSRSWPQVLILEMQVLSQLSDFLSLAH